MSLAIFVGKSIVFTICFCFISIFTCEKLLPLRGGKLHIEHIHRVEGTYSSPIQIRLHP